MVSSQQPQQPKWMTPFEMLITSCDFFGTTKEESHTVNPHGKYEKITTPTSLSRYRVEYQVWVEFSVPTHCGQTDRPTKQRRSHLSRSGMARWGGGAVYHSTQLVGHAKTCNTFWQFRFDMSKRNIKTELFRFDRSISFWQVHFVLTDHVLTGPFRFDGSRFDMSKRVNTFWQVHRKFSEKYF